jgi:hypothetical protein
MIRACVDANVLISHLLKPLAGSPPNRVIEAAVAGEIELILIQTTVDEVIERVRSKPYLAERIPLERAHDLMTALRIAGSVLPETLDHLPALTRDPGDDYLIAHALLHRADVIVSGDQDLLELGVFEGVRIVSPATFAALLDRLD